MPPYIQGLKRREQGLKRRERWPPLYTCTCHPALLLCRMSLWLFLRFHITQATDIKRSWTLTETRLWDHLGKCGVLNGGGQELCHRIPVCVVCECCHGVCGILKKSEREHMCVYGSNHHCGNGLDHFAK